MKSTALGLLLFMSVTLLVQLSNTGTSGEECMPFEFVTQVIFATDMLSPTPTPTAPSPTTVLPPAPNYCCPPLSVPTNGSITSNDTSPNTTVTFFCEACYALIGEENLTCINGMPSMWNNEEPKCDVKNCNRTLAAPMNGAKNSNSTSCGTTVDFSCDGCYELVGNNQLSCLPNGTWTSDEPSCSLIHCTALAEPINGTKSSNSTSCGTTVDFSCDSCFYLVGDKQLVCQSDGLWNGSEPVCEPAYVDLNKADNSTLNPPVIILEEEAPRRFLVEHPESLDVVGFDAEDWTQLELELHIPVGLELNALFQETVEYKRDAAFTDGRRITLDEYTALSNAVGTGGGSIMPPSVRLFLIDNEGSANLKHVLLSLQYNNDQDPILGETRFVELRVHCEQSVSRVVNITIQHVGENDAIPVVNISDANADFVEGTTEPVAITNNSLFVSDTDSDHFRFNQLLFV